MSQVKRTFVALCFTFSILNLSATVKLPTVLGDNMVLQQQSDVKLWGEAQANAIVKVKPSWDKKTHSVQSDKEGKWLLTVPTPAAGGPYEINISDGKELILKNILIGEVWFCSGQSNMEMPVKGFDRQPVEGSNSVIAKAKPSTPIRIYTTDSQEGKWVRQFNKQPQSDCVGKWLENSSENAANTSAVAYFFAQYLQEVLDVPVGIIISSWGGSRVEAWMSTAALAPFPEIDLSILSNEEEVKNPTATPCVLFNGKIAPLIPFTIKGFLWYQGESNRDNAPRYRKLMAAFVKDLRHKWNIGDFPFFYVQITPYNYDGANLTSSAKLQEAQMKNMEDIPNAGMVTTLDIGNPVSIHPSNKRTVGERLAYWALGNTYAKKGFGYKPAIYKSMEVVDGKIYINFENAPRGLSPMWTDLKGFEIAGEDKVFYPAKAEIETKSARLAVSSESVAVPVAVRYAYKNYVEASIFGVDGIPVSPFRTDNW
ncbi:MAG: sialate O-acetylesterase [Dysgonamonadaceae bacterium]|nr:sialate O-acetylesterase [Dysgonamonadaceae bacterium]